VRGRRAFVVVREHPPDIEPRRLGFEGWGVSSGPRDLLGEWDHAAINGKARGPRNPAVWAPR